ncbi:MAG TPA: hypothetical protein PLO73_11405 [Spirochaetota bacterium]|nr:hypothetical protein [Spirochaetota bacterium]HPP50570.1 hypothetical protein [Spirochaetota bacterium]
MNSLRITGIIRHYTRRARDQIYNAGLTIFKAANCEQHLDDIGACVDELIKNAVKANYKHLIIVEALQRQFQLQYKDKTGKQVQEYIKDILKDKIQFDTLASIVLKKENIAQKVREVLNQEGLFLLIKNKAFSENRSLTSDDLQSIEKLKLFVELQQKLKQYDIRIILKIELRDNYIYIEITNTAPILSHDLQRIYAKREEYRRYKDEGREYEFFINNIDTSDSGFGLGYAKIDSYLYNLGIDPEKAVTVISINNTTAMLSIPVEALKKL